MSVSGVDVMTCSELEARIVARGLAAGGAAAAATCGAGEFGADLDTSVSE